MMKNNNFSRTFALACAIILFLSIFSPSVDAQDFSAAFAAELQFQIPPFSLNSTIFDVLLAASVSDAVFASHTQFDLTGLRSQQFSIDLLLGGLIVRDRLLFQPSLDFERNSLLVKIQMLGFNLALETILEELGPPSPDVNPGLVVEAGGRSKIGVGITSFTGFGVTQIVEDTVTIYPCISIELFCLGTQFPDDEFDRVVVKPFIFSEQAVRLDFNINPVTLAVTPLFTLSGLSKLLLEASLDLNSPDLRFAALTTLDTAAVIALARQQILFEAEVGIIGWRAVTIFSGSPITFEAQTLKLRLAYHGFNLYSTAIFTIAGFSELRVGAGFQF